MEFGRDSGDRTTKGIEGAQVIDFAKRQKGEKGQKRGTKVHAGYTEYSPNESRAEPTNGSATYTSSAEHRMQDVCDSRPTSLMDPK